MDDLGGADDRRSGTPPGGGTPQTCPILLDFFRRRLPAHHRELAEDLSQETLLAMLRALEAGKIEGVTDRTSYALGIARRKFNDLLRIQYRENRMLEGSGRAGGSSAPARERDVEEGVLHAEWRRLLHKALRRLNREERELLLLLFFLDLDHREACRQLKISSPQGSRLKYRAIEKLRFELRVGRQRSR